MTILAHVKCVGCGKLWCTDELRGWIDFKCSNCLAPVVPLLHRKLRLDKKHMYRRKVT